MKIRSRLFSALIALLFVFPLSGQSNLYMSPPKAITELITAPPVPDVIFSNDYKKGVVTYRKCNLCDLEYVAGPEFRIAGLRIDPVFSLTRQLFFDRLSIIDVATGKETPVTGLPENPKILNVNWSPAGKYICFTHNGKERVELWRADASTGKAEKLSTLAVNCVLGDPYRFLSEDKILYKNVPSDIGPVPPPPVIPSGPVIQENNGQARSARTSPDMITSFYDEQLFEYFATSELSIYSPEGNIIVGKPGIYRTISVSPDKNYYIATTIQKPYSYQRGFQSFPYLSSVFSISGEMLKKLEDNKTGSLSSRGDEIESYNDVIDDQNDTTAARGRRIRQTSWMWRSDMPHTLVWCESAGGGRGFRGGNAPADPADEQQDSSAKQAPPVPTTVYQQEAPFSKPKEIVLKYANSVSFLQWSTSGFALFTSADNKAKVRNTLLFNPCDTLTAPRIILSQTTEADTTGLLPAIGRPCLITNSFGEKVIYSDSKSSCIYLTDGKRRNAEGDNFWFIDKLDLKSGKITNVWTGAAPYAESVEGIVDFKNLIFISRKESVKDVPNYYVNDLKTKKSREISFFSDPYPALQKLQRRFIEYKRADGLILTANLWLPEGYDQSRDGKLPVFMWGYPYEYKTRAEAEKRRAYRYTFARPGYASPIFWATQGFAILDDFSVPIVAEAKNKEPNDRFLKELIMDAEAAINYVDSIGVGDKNRVAVGGHSYGAFMTVNLLAHTNLFKAGIARSGAYNRTLTPFGFQSEPRNYWKAEVLYNEMSPFNYADKIKTPLLMFHGQIDNNQGTFPIQSERLFQALCGLGGTVRYVQLPFESHRYGAKESVLHVLYETDLFLKKYLKKD